GNRTGEKMSTLAQIHLLKTMKANKINNYYVRTCNNLMLARLHYTTFMKILHVAPKKRFPFSPKRKAVHLTSPSHGEFKITSS
ncbi:hypothetical protein ABTP16_00035, partial [Acinetobacter baumannii]